LVFAQASCDRLGIADERRSRTRAISPKPAHKSGAISQSCARREEPLPINAFIRF